MRILTVENQPLVLDSVPSQVDDLRFMVLDNSDPANVDFFAVPLIFLESFSAPAVILDIGGHRLKMPVDWKVLVGDAEYGDLEVLPLSCLNDRDITAFVYNPISGFQQDYEPIAIVDVYSDVKWYFPKLRPGQMLAVPLSLRSGSKCVYFIKELTKQSEIVSINDLW